MIINNSSFFPKGNPGIWRYMDFTKVVDMLNSGSLFFANADQFDDPFEGSLTVKDFDERYDYYQALMGEETASIFSEGGIYSKFCAKNNKKFGISCWHMNEYESAAMWKLYVTTNEGIAIKSTFNRLKNVLEETRLNILLGTVKYIDYDKETIPEDNSRYLYKRKSFTHEQELRAVIPKENENNLNLVSDKEHGIVVKVNLPKLVETIHVSPDSPLWLTNLIKDTVKKFEFSFSVVNSKLDNRPLF